MEVYKRWKSNLRGHIILTRFDYNHNLYTWDLVQTIQNWKTSHLGYSSR